jgi:hypothetical protein
MRRLVGIVLVAMLFSLTSIAMATDSEYYKDRFTSIGWAGSDGSLHWSGPWSEVNDDGDEKKGSVRVVSSGHCAQGNCMRIAGGITLLDDIGARRTADTRDMEDLSLCYDLKNVTSVLPLGLTELRVQVQGNGGWVTIAEHDLGSDFSGHYTHEDLDDFESMNFKIRFLVSGAAMTSEVFIDNVEVEGELDDEPDGTTTTTTSSTTSSTTSTTIGETTTTTAAGSTTSTSTPVTTTTTQPRASTTTTTTGEPSTSTTTTTPTTTPGNSPGDQTIAPDISLSTTTTTTTPGNSTDSEAIISADEDGSDGLGTSSGGSGIKAAARGVQANFQGDLFGDARTVSSLGGVDLQADYTIAAEVIRSSWAWMVLLGLVMAWAIVSRLDRNRPDLDV